MTLRGSLSLVHSSILTNLNTKRSFHHSLDDVDETQSLCESCDTGLITYIPDLLAQPAESATRKLELSFHCTAATRPPLTTVPQHHRPTRDNSTTPRHTDGLNSKMSSSAGPPLDPAAAAAMQAAAEAAMRQFTIEAFTLLAVAISVTILRTYARMRGDGIRGLGWDDYFVWMGVVCFLTRLCPTATSTNAPTYQNLRSYRQPMPWKRAWPIRWAPSPAGWLTTA